MRSAMENLRRSAVVALFACAVLGCENRSPVPPERLPVADAGGVDAGADAGESFVTCSVAAQDCDGGAPCIPFRTDAGTLGAGCFEGCNVVRQDCGAGLRCTYVEDAGVSVRACVPDGTAGEGEPCGGGTGVSCRAGLICFAQTALDGGVAQVCRRFCNTTADCTSPEACFLTLLPPGTDERPLVCDRPCELFAAQCAPGLACYPGPIVPGCYPAGTTPLGAPCNFSDDCQPGAACVDGSCRQLCAHPEGEPGCDGGTCNDLDVPGAPAVGFCE